MLKCTLFLLFLFQFFHYQGGAYPPPGGLFKDHVVWSGDVMKGDGSITLQDVQFSFNGTYSCQVLNPPDFQGFAGEIKLRVVQKGESRCCDARLKNELEKSFTQTCVAAKVKVVVFFL